VLAICNHPADPGGEAIPQAAGAPLTSLSTIDDVYPQRPDQR
jgi:hypothetical protein